MARLEKMLRFNRTEIRVSFDFVFVYLVLSRSTGIRTTFGDSFFSACFFLVSFSFSLSLSRCRWSMLRYSTRLQFKAIQRCRFDVFFSSFFLSHPSTSFSILVRMRSRNTNTGKQIINKKKNRKNKNKKQVWNRLKYTHGVREGKRWLRTRGWLMCYRWSPPGHSAPYYVWRQLTRLEFASDQMDLPLRHVSPA